MTGDFIIFDRARVRRNRDRASGVNTNHLFLHHWAARSLSDRLADVRREFPLALSIGARGMDAFQHEGRIGHLVTMDLSHPSLPPALAVQGDEELLPFGPATFDLVLSSLALHTVNDLPGTLIQIAMALKPDGLFMGALLGGETLHELRQVLAEAEMTVRGGVSPRVFPFADKPQMGNLLQRAGFALPVVDSDIVTVTYGDVFQLMNDLRLMGEGNAIWQRDARNPGKALFMEAARLYQEKFAEPDGRITATFEIIFLIGWAPHESQQKPLKRGSATARLADVLSTKEIGSGEKPGPS